MNNHPFCRTLAEPPANVRFYINMCVHDMPPTIFRRCCIDWLCLLPACRMYMLCTNASLSLSLSLSLYCSLLSLKHLLHLACRVAVVTAWKEKNTTIQAALDAIMSTDLFKTAQSHCQAEIERYNRASGVVCLLDKESSYAYEFTYNSFWGSDDGYYFDGDYDLATMFPQTANFTKIGDFAPCLADCYTGLGNGCELFKSQGWMTNYGNASWTRSPATPTSLHTTHSGGVMTAITLMGIMIWQPCFHKRPILPKLVTLLLVSPTVTPV